MTAREKLNEIKDLLDLKSDNELSDFLQTNKSNIDSWVKRNKIPEKWQIEIGHILGQNAIGKNIALISGKNNTVSNARTSEHSELFDLIQNYATPKLIQEFKQKLLKIKAIHGD